MKLAQIILEKEENTQVDSALKQTFDKLGKELASSSDDIVQDQNNVNEAAGVLLVAGIALAIPEIVKIVGISFNFTDILYAQELWLKIVYGIIFLVN